MSLNFGQNLFPQRGEIITSYDYFDIANGVGYDIYYGFSNAGTTGTGTISTIYSGMIHKNGARAETFETSYVELLDTDFDITFNNPKNIKGDILIQVPFGVNRRSVQSQSVHIMKAEVSVFHYDGSSETQMGSTATSELISFNTTDINHIVSHISTVKVTQSTVKHFKPGETLRFTIKVFVKDTNSSGIAAEFVGGIGCDPQNRTDAKIELEVNNDTELQVITNKPTQLAFHVPFKLNI